MIVVWRGRGYVALAAPILPLGLFAAAMVIGESVRPNPDMILGLPFLAVGFLAAGFLCYRYGRRWNADGNFHGLYWIPIQYWGIFYLTIGGLLSLALCLRLLNVFPK